MERSDQKWLFPVFLVPKSKSLGELFMEHSFKRLKLKEFAEKRGPGCSALCLYSALF